MNDRDFRQHIQSHVARVAVGASAVRGRGNAGVVAAARDFLRGLSLDKFGTGSKNAFRRRLDRTTEDLRRCLPPRARHWGLARKLLNIFLRDALYTWRLRDDFHLGEAEPFFEIPLDSITARRLARGLGRHSLPRWPGVKHLTPEASALYQEAAARVARGLRIDRVHLDAIFWSSDRDESSAAGARRG